MVSVENTAEKSATDRLLAWRTTRSAESLEALALCHNDPLPSRRSEQRTSLIVIVSCAQIVALLLGRHTDPIAAASTDFLQPSNRITAEKHVRTLQCSSLRSGGDQFWYVYTPQHPTAWFLRPFGTGSVEGPWNHVSS